MNASSILTTESSKCGSPRSILASRFGTIEIVATTAGSPSTLMM
jgi:hypothetical protein